MSHPCIHELQLVPASIFQTSLASAAALVPGFWAAARRGPADHDCNEELQVRGQRKVGRESFLPGALDALLAICRLPSFFCLSGAYIWNS